MKVNVFRTQCVVGNRVEVITEKIEGRVTKISKDGYSALVQLDNGTKAWYEYHQLNLI